MNNNRPGRSDMSMMAEFKAFAMKGSVMDLAIGVIIGGAFGKIVDSLVGASWEAASISAGCSSRSVRRPRAPR